MGTPTVYMIKESGFVVYMYWCAQINLFAVWDAAE